MASTQNVTILFTDLVNSTELASGLAPEAADELRRGHFSSLRRAIASSGGTEVKNLGDGLMVAFSTASEALSCAVGMQQAVEVDNRDAEQPLGVRVGLSGGEVTREGDDYFGDPVIEAARLCARADGGQILVSDLVRATAGRRSPHLFRSVGALELKGLPESVEAVEIGWEPLGEPELAPDVVPLPSRLSYRPSIGVIGRESEAASLADAFKRVAAGQGREVVLVSGEAGLGKTTLAAEGARAAHDAGAGVLLGRCDEDLSVPYGAFVEAVTHYVTNGPEDMLRAHVQAHGGELARLAPAVAKRLGDLPGPQSSDPDTERYLLLGAVVALLTEATASQPLVLVLDDLQWADKPSLQLLRHVVASDELMRLLVVGTYRDSELSGSHPLVEVLGALQREPGVSRIELQGLDDTGVIAFMEAAAGHDLDDAGVGLAHALYRETDGNPFFVGEMLRHLAETGAIHQAETGQWTPSGDLGEMALPVSVLQVIAARVARLGERAGRALSLAAVIGRDFDLELLARVSECNEDELLDILDGAAAAALVREVADVPGRYSFSHVLVQHTLYQDLGATRGARAHRQVAEALEAICGDRPGGRVGELARHWSSATQPVDAAKAISYSRQAGEAALAALAPDDAIRYFSQALDLADRGTTVDAPTRIDLLIGLGTAQRQAGVPDFRATLLEAARRARQLGDAERLTDAALANNRGLFSAVGQIDTDRVEMLEAALDAVSNSESPQRALLLSRLCAELSFGPLERRVALATEARSLARRLNDPATFCAVVADCGIPLRIPSMLEERLADYKEAVGLAVQLDDPVRLFWVLAAAHDDATRAGEFDLNAEWLATAVELAQRLQQPALVWTATFRQAENAMLHGDATLAEKLAATALEVGSTTGQPDAFTFYGTQLVEIRRQQGRLGELAPLLAELADDNPGVPTYRAALAAAYLDADDQGSALQLVESAAEEGFALPMDTAWLDGMLNYAYAVRELGLTGAAEQLLQLLAPYYAQVPVQGLTPHEPVAMFLGALATVLGRYGEAEEYFTDASELNARGNMKYAEANTQLQWGRMLAARGLQPDLERAQGLLEQARASAQTNGYGMIERRAAAALSSMN